MRALRVHGRVRLVGTNRIKSRTCSQPSGHLDLYEEQLIEYLSSFHIPEDYRLKILEAHRKLEGGHTLESKSSKVYIFENGPVALNPLLSEAHVNTKTVHPLFLQQFRSLISAAFSVNLTIDNPFLYKTKGEVASLTAKKSARKLLPMTNSYLDYARIPANAKQWFNLSGYQGRHDGECLPCVLRRVAMHSASIPTDGEDYLINVFDIFGSPLEIRFPDRARDIIATTAALLRFCQWVRRLPEPELLLCFPDFSVSANGVDYDKLIAMYRRHTKEVIQCFQDKSAESFEGVFRTALEP